MVQAYILIKCSHPGNYFEQYAAMLGLKRRECSGLFPPIFVSGLYANTDEEQKLQKLIKLCLISETNI